MCFQTPHPHTNIKLHTLTSKPQPLHRDETSLRPAPRSTRLLVPVHSFVLQTLPMHHSCDALDCVHPHTSPKQTTPTFPSAGIAFDFPGQVGAAVQPANAPSPLGMRGPACTAGPPRHSTSLNGPTGPSSVLNHPTPPTRTEQPPARLVPIYYGTPKSGRAYAVFYTLMW